MEVSSFEMKMLSIFFNTPEVSKEQVDELASKSLDYSKFYEEKGSYDQKSFL